MKTIWKKVTDSSYNLDGCKLSEEETNLLIRLAGVLSMDFLHEKGFSTEEAQMIQKWMYAI